MARRLNRHGLALLIVVAAVVLAACAPNTKPKAATGLQARTQQIGGLEVTVTPTQLDSRGAAFTITFDTHTGAPTINVASSAHLTVDGTAWTGATWSDDGPGGHHRTGTLRFPATGPTRGAARLSINGLAAPVDMTWQLAS